MFWERARNKRIGTSILIALAIAIFISFFTDTSGESMLHRGDFPGFYVQGEILRRGLAEKLYDPELQRSIENELWPSFKGSFYMAAYPPYTAALIYPLTFLGQQNAQIAFTLSMLLFFTLTLLAARKVNSSLDEKTLLVAALLLLSAPILSGVFGAQNTALSMALYAGAICFSRHKTKQCDMAAGVLLGLWLFKPQYALFSIIVAGLIGKRPYILAGALPVAAMYYVIGAVVSGAQWPIEWLSVARAFGDQNFIANRSEMVSALGTMKGFSIELGMPSLPVASLIGAFIALLLFYRLSILTMKHVGKSALFFLGPFLVLVSPQTLFYDLGIAIVPLLFCIDFNRQKSLTIAAVLCAASLPLFYLRSTLGIPIFSIFSLLFLLFQEQRLAQDNQ